MIEISTKRAILCGTSITLLGAQTVLAQGTTSVPLWEQTVCMTVLTALGLFAAPPEMIIDVIRSRAGTPAKKSD